MVNLINGMLLYVRYGYITKVRTCISYQVLCTVELNTAGREKISIHLFLIFTRLKPYGVLFGCIALDAPAHVHFVYLLVRTCRISSIHTHPHPHHHPSASASSSVVRGVGTSSLSTHTLQHPQVVIPYLI